MAGLILLLFLPFSLLWNAFVLQLLWAWFAVPVFGVGAITLSQAVGIALISTLLTHQRSGVKDQDGEDALTDAVVFTFVVPLLALGIGWVVK